MPQWAANTLRTLGIIFTIGATLTSSLVLLFMSMCAGGSEGPPGPGFPYFIGAIAAAVAGIWITVLLARGIANSTAAALAMPRYAVASSGPAVSVAPPPSPAAPPSSFTQPLQLTSLGQAAVDRLVWAMGAQIAVSIVCWFLNQQFFWTEPSKLAPHNWMLILLTPFVLYRVPYVLLIYGFLKRPENRTLVYALIVPAILALQAVFNLGAVVYAFVQHPAGFLLLFLPWCIHIVIVILAWKAIREAGLQPDGSYLFRAGLVTFGYFFVVHIVSPLFYLFARR